MTTKVEKTITVDVPVTTAYNQWTQFEDFPEFMGGVQQVEQLDDRRLHWVAQIGGVKREWYATILEQRQDEKVAWAATEGATNAGAVYFSPTGAGQTLVRLELEYEPEGAVEKVGDALSIVDRQAKSDLDKFKAFIEGRHDETGAWRGDIEGRTVGTPGVESATSHGDSGKAGISGKAAAAAGVAAVAAGAAAVAAARSGSDEESDTSRETTEIPAVPVVDVVEVEPVGRVDDVDIDATTPGVSDQNDGHPPLGTV
jgi:carbon monoxide dehydrogenase subunit G